MAGFGLRRAGLIAGAVLLVGVALTGFAGQRDVEATRAGVPAPFELAGYTFVGRVDLTPYASDQLPIFPQGLALGADDLLYVGDASLMRVLALHDDDSLTFETQVGEPPDMDQLLEAYQRVGGDWASVARAVDGRISLTSAADGHIYVGGDLGMRVHQITPTGQIAATWRPPLDFSTCLTGAGFLAAGDGAIFFSQRFSCGIGVLYPDGVAEVLVSIAGCPPRSPEDIAVAGERLYFALSTEDRRTIVVLVYDLSGQLVEEIGVDVASDPPGVTNAFPMRILVERDGNLLILTWTILARDDDGLVTEVHLLTVSPTGDMLATSELPGTDGWIDVDIARDGTLGILYRDSTEVLLFEPVSP